MIGNGIHCSTTDPCAPNPCHPGVKCSVIYPEDPSVNEVKYKCDLCPNEMVGDGVHCYPKGVECGSQKCFPGN